MTIKIQPLQITKPKIKALIYGPPGAGKTVLISTAQESPDMGDVLVANIDGGLLSIASSRGILEAPISSVADLEDLQAMAARGAPELANVKTIAVDSGTEIFEAYMREIAAREHAANPKMRDPIKNEIQDYGEATVRLTRIFRWLRDLPYHVIVTALDKADRRVVDTRKKSKQEAEVLAVYPKFPDKLCSAVMATFDFVWYLAATEDGTRAILTQPNGVVLAKTRGQKFAKEIGPVVHNPNLAELYATLIRTESNEP